MAFIRFLKRELGNKFPALRLCQAIENTETFGGSKHVKAGPTRFEPTGKFCQFDLLGVSKPILASPEFQNQGYAPEVYAFVAFIFWVMCFSMSRASQRLETKLGVGTR